MRIRIPALLCCLGIALFHPDDSAAQWTPIRGLGGPRILPLWVSGSNIFAGTSRHGVFRSQNDGLSWEPAKAKIPFEGLFNVFIQVEGSQLVVRKGNTILRSLDDGKTWTDITPVLPKGESLTCLARGERKLLAGTNEGLIFRSTDGGASWSEFRLRFPEDIKKKGSWHEPFSINGLAVFGSELLIGTPEGFFLCLDLEHSAKAVSLRSPGYGVQRWFPRLTMAGWKIIVTAGVGEENRNFLLKKDARGWTVEEIKLPREGPINAVAASEPYLVFATDEGVFLTHDGITWTEGRSEWGLRPGATCLAMSGSTLWAGTEYGVFRSTDTGLNWEPLNSGLPSEAFIGGMAKAGSSLFATAQGRVFRSTDGGNTWAYASKGLPCATDHVLSIVAAENGLFAITWPWRWSLSGEKAFRSVDNGENWTPVGGNLSHLRDLAAVGDHLVAVVADRFYLSKDGGESWHSGFSFEGMSASSLYASKTTLFAGIYEPPVWEMDVLRRSESCYFGFSTDYGLSWTFSDARFSMPVNCFANIGDDLFVGTEKGLYLCRDYSGLRKPVKLKISEPISVWALEVVGTDLYAATDKGVFVIRSKAKDFAVSSMKIAKHVRVTCLAFLGGRLFAGTLEDGVWQRPLSDIKTEKR